MIETELFDAVKKVIETDVRPFIEADGGKIKLKDIKDGIVYVQLSGACAGCPAAGITLRGSVERIIKMKFQEVKNVRMVV